MTDAAPDWIDGDPDQLRRWRNASPEVVNPVLPDDVAITALAPDGACPGGLICTPDRVAGVPVVYFHGGGFVVGSPETHRINTAWIAHLTRAPVFSIRYRLAPEHIFPAQAEDAVAAVRRQLRIHPRLRLMGDSAGGLVALWAHAGLTAQERARIGDVVLFYPGGTASIPRPAGLGEDEAGGLGPKSLAAYQRRLDPNGIAGGDARYDPMAEGFAAPERMTILGAGADPILYQAQALADRLKARLLVAGGEAHSFLAALPAEPAITYLKRALGETP